MKTWLTWRLTLIPTLALALTARVAPSAERPGGSVLAPATQTDRSVSDTLLFTPGDSLWVPVDHDYDIDYYDRGVWMRPPFGDNLLTDPDEWRARDEGQERGDILLDYNRVDRLRLGVRYQIQSENAMYPRIGTALEYAFDRKRVLYGAQFEQPLIPPGRIAVGVSMVRRTDHNELQQVENIENSLALLFARQDYRDYFEREGFGAYLSWKVPDFSRIGIHLRSDEYRSLPENRGTRSFFHRGRALRGNPAIDEGTSRSAIVRLDRLAHRTRRTRSGFYHWVDLERAGHGLGGDFEFTRLLADLRSVVRLTPATTLALRLVGGRTFYGALPSQRHFTVGGVDGLRGHAFDQYRGDQMLLGQAEYTVGLWRLRSGLFEGGLHAIVFLDSGLAWFGSDNRWDLGRQKIRTDGGFGIGTSEDNLRVYFAKNLRDPDSDFVISLRLQRPF